MNNIEHISVKSILESAIHDNKKEIIKFSSEHVYIQHILKYDDEIYSSKNNIDDNFFVYKIDDREGFPQSINKYVKVLNYILIPGIKSNGDRVMFANIYLHNDLFNNITKQEDSICYLEPIFKVVKSPNWTMDLGYKVNSDIKVSSVSNKILIHEDFNFLDEFLSQFPIKDWTSNRKLVDTLIDGEETFFSEIEFFKEALQKEREMNINRIIE